MESRNIIKLEKILINRKIHTAKDKHTLKTVLFRICKCQIYRLQNYCTVPDFTLFWKVQYLKSDV